MSFRRRFTDAAKRLGVAFLLESEEAVLEFVRGYMNSKVKPFGPGHLARAIERHGDLWGNVPEKWKVFGRRFVKDPRTKQVIDKYSDKINSDTVLKWLKQDRPELFSIIINWPTPEARLWLDEEVGKVKAGILGTGSV